jgi:hypothetical protein
MPAFLSIQHLHELRVPVQKLCFAQNCSHELCSHQDHSHRQDLGLGFRRDKPFHQTLELRFRLDHFVRQILDLCFRRGRFHGRTLNWKDVLSGVLSRDHCHRYLAYHLKTLRPVARFAGRQVYLK